MTVDPLATRVRILTAYALGSAMLALFFLAARVEILDGDAVESVKVPR